MAYTVPPDVQVVDTQLDQPLTDAQLRAEPVEVTGTLEVDFPSDLAKEATQLRRLGGGKIPVCNTVVASGDTTIHTPAAGKAIRLYWISAINNPVAESSTVISVRIGSTEYYRVYALAHWEVFTGGVDESLIINLSSSGSVQVTAHIEEI